MHIFTDDWALSRYSRRAEPMGIASNIRRRARMEREGMSGQQIERYNVKLYSRFLRANRSSRPGWDIVYGWRRSSIRKLAGMRRESKESGKKAEIPAPEAGLLY